MNALKTLLVLGLLFTITGCLPEKFGQDRIDQLCGNNRCHTATTTEETRFEPDQHAGRTKNHCGSIRGNQMVPAGLTVQVAAVMPEGSYNNAALVGWVDTNGEAHVGWIDADFLGNWSPSEMIGLIDHCSTYP